MNIEKYSLGIGDRFGMEGAAQLRALQEARNQGIEIVPVWNKSNREHSLIGTSPDDVRSEADNAVQACRWRNSYYVDADHIGLATVDKFLSSSNFYTIDVADAIGRAPSSSSAAAFLKDMSRFKGKLVIPGIEQTLEVTDRLLTEIAGNYLAAIQEAGKVYRHLLERKGKGQFIAEVSVDESDKPQSPVELFFILAAIAREHIELQTIAPKFTGWFLKGVDYVGEVGAFAREFEDDLAVIAFAKTTFGLPANLKLSVHSGSDKFSLYPLIHDALKRHAAGLHLKTAGTTWLEEMIGLAGSDQEGLRFAQQLYAAALERYDELAKPYLPVISIDKSRLPDPRAVLAWTSEEFVEALRHDQSCSRYNVHFRQLVHIAFRLAAESGERFISLLKARRTLIEANVTANIFENHIKPLFLGRPSERFTGGTGQRVAASAGGGGKVPAA